MCYFLGKVGLERLWQPSLLHTRCASHSTLACITNSILFAQVREQFQIQLFIQGTSASLKLELARFARNHVQDLPVDAKPDQLVQAARQFLIGHEGQVLLVVDNVADPEAILQLLPTHSAHVLMTVHTASCPRALLDEMQVATDGATCHKVDALTTKESMEMLMSGKWLWTARKEVLANVAIMARIEQFVEEGLGNLPIGVAKLKNVLKGLGIAEATEVMNQSDSSLVESLQSVAVDRYLG